MNNLLTIPFYKWNIHDWIYAQVTDYKCFDGLALGKKFFKDFIYWCVYCDEQFFIRSR